MGVIGLLGATGRVGSLTAEALDARGLAFIAAGRDEIALELLTADLESAVGHLVVDVDNPDALAELAGGVAVVASAVTPFGRIGGEVLDAALEAGCAYVDCATEQRHLLSALRDRGDRPGGSAAVVGCGALTGIGDLLAGIAAAEVNGPLEVHVAYLAQGLRRVAAPGLRVSLADHLGHPTLVWEGGRLREEGVAQRRRLSWFPRPIGPRSAVAIPTGEPVTVPCHVPGVGTVRSYLAVRGPTAELLQALDAAARRPGVRRWLRDRLVGGRTPPGSSGPAQRWACVAEAQGEDGGIGRAWAYGRGLAQVTAALLAATADRLVTGRVAGDGVVPVAAAVPAAELLNEVADVAGMRWSVQEPLAADGSGHPLRR